MSCLYLIENKAMRFTDATRYNATRELDTQFESRDNDVLPKHTQTP